MTVSCLLLFLYSNKTDKARGNTIIVELRGMGKRMVANGDCQTFVSAVCFVFMTYTFESDGFYTVRSLQLSVEG